MSKSRFGGKALLLLALGVVYAEMLSGYSHAQQTKVTAAISDERILPSQVTLANREAFVEQVRNDLPVGMPKADVEAYLTRWNILHSFFGTDPVYGSYKNSFQGRLINIGELNGSALDLLIWIILDANEKVDRITFRVDYS